MKFYKELLSNLDAYNFDFVRQYKTSGVEYLNVEAAFDIETSKSVVNDTAISHMYIWQLGLGYGNVFYGRTWEQFKECVNALSKHYELGYKRRLRIYIHNMSYEFSFMHKLFNWNTSDMFSIKENVPITALTDLGIEFRDSYILSGSSLDVTAKNLSHFNIKKLTGQLDYELVRTATTPLTDSEMQYAENDVLVILAYINEQIKLYNNNLACIPLTNTQRVRHYVRDECFGRNIEDKDERTKQVKMYKKLMRKKLTMNANTYESVKLAFAGGFTNVNAFYQDTVIYDVASYDLNSSYPAVMISEKFPMSEFKLTTKQLTQKQFEALCESKALVFDIEFTNLKAKGDYEFYITESRCNITGKKGISNGQVIYADKLSTTITNIDLETIQRCYTWDSYGLANVYIANMGYLPVEIIRSVLSLYKDKTQLKGVKGMEAEYTIAKNMLNSMYGMCVTDIVRDTSIYNDGQWGAIEADIDETIQANNDSHSRTLYYPWGVFITAYARRNLWSAILAIGDDYVYSDTDCVKFINKDKHQKYFDWFNQTIELKAKLMCCHHKINESELNPKTQNGKARMLGVWDYEGTYSRFKALSSKRYMYEMNNKLHLAVSGLNKKSALHYMLQECNYNHTKVFNMFNNRLYIPADYSGKTVSYLIHEERTAIVTDYLGNECTVTSPSGVYIEKVPYTLRTEDVFDTLLNTIVQAN